MMRATLRVALGASVVGVALPRDAAAQNYYILPSPTTVLPPSTDAPQPLIRALLLMSPFPVVRIVGRVTRRGARIRLLSVRAPASASILARCFRRRCRARSQTRGRGFGTPVRFRRFERSLRSGTIIEVRVARGDAIGKFTRFRIRRGRRPARKDLCLRPGESRGTACPEL